MNQQSKPGIMTPALIGGAVAGVLSGIPLLGCLCCLWIIGGAMLAVHLAAKSFPAGLKAGDGAIIGVLTGVIAAVVDAVISIPLQAMNAELLQRLMERFAEYSSQIPGDWREMMERGMGQPSLAWFFVGLVISAAIFAALGAVGGVIGASLFGKKAEPQPPQPQGGTGAPQDPSHS